MALPSYVGPAGIAWHYGFRFFCALVLIFLMLPILVIIPLSFNAEPYFTYSEGMLALDPAAYSLRWYLDILKNGMVAPKALFSWSWIQDSWANAQWIHSTKNSFIIGFAATLIATTLGTLASLGLTRPHMPFRKAITALLISPGVISGALFAFITSFDEVVVVLFLTKFEQRTIPRQMYAGIREQISPTILAVATLLVIIAVLLLLTMEMLRRRNERMRGLSPG